MARSREIVQNGRIRVAVDAMGGDYPPGEIVKGAVLAAHKDDVEVFLVGVTSVLESELAKHKFTTNGSYIHIVGASDFIRENESPVDVIRRRPDCSVAVATKMVKSGEADALFSAGSSGAAAISAIQYIGMVDGVYRPALVGSLGSFASNTVMVDLGANVDCKPHQFLAFAIAGSVYVTGGGPGNSTETLSIYAYKTLFQTLQFGYGSALATTMFLLGLLFTLGYVFLLRGYLRELSR